MAVDTSLQEVLSSFKSAADSAIQSLPEATSILPPKDGISLLNAKNEIFLSYLQSLALRNLNVIRSLKDGSSVDDVQELSDKLTAKLVEHRVYLERGVKPLELKIKYQVDRTVKAADDEERISVQREKQTNGKKTPEDDEGSETDTESSDENEDIAADATSYAPNLAGLARAKGNGAVQSHQSRSEANSVYRPPRISATSMPTTEQREAKPRKAERSATMDEYVRNELSTAPLAQPSIGSTITADGRRTKDARQLAREQERRDYEETHLMRLPPESKKERAKQKARERNAGFGGEEWRGLGESVDRIGDLTRQKKGSALERSRKRRAVEDGPRNDGSGIGGAFDIKKRRVMKKMKR